MSIEVLGVALGAHVVRGNVYVFRRDGSIALVPASGLNLATLPQFADADHFNRNFAKIHDPPLEDATLFRGVWFTDVKTFDTYDAKIEGILRGGVRAVWLRQGLFIADPRLPALASLTNQSKHEIEFVDRVYRDFIATCVLPAAGVSASELVRSRLKTPAHDLNIVCASDDQGVVYARSNAYSDDFPYAREGEFTYLDVHPLQFRAFHLDCKAAWTLRRFIHLVSDHEDPHILRELQKALHDFMDEETHENETNLFSVTHQNYATVDNLLVLLKTRRVALERVIDLHIVAVGPVDVVRVTKAPVNSLHASLQQIAGEMPVGSIARELASDERLKVNLDRGQNGFSKPIEQFPVAGNYVYFVLHKLTGQLPEQNFKSSSNDAPINDVDFTKILNATYKATRATPESFFRRAAFFLRKYGKNAFGAVAMFITPDKKFVLFTTNPDRREKAEVFEEDHLLHGSRKQFNMVFPLAPEKNMGPLHCVAFLLWMRHMWLEHNMVCDAALFEKCKKGPSTDHIRTIITKITRLMGDS